MLSAAEHFGKAALNASRSLQDTFSFALTVFLHLFRKKTYGSTSRKVLLSQIYFTAIQILPLFVTIAVIIGFSLIGIVFQTLKELGLAEYLGRIIMGFIVTELSPFITVLLIALRSSSAMNAEIAVMKVNRELQSLETFNVDVMAYLFMPRIMSGLISTVLLSGIFSIVVLATGFVSSKLFFTMSLDTYSNLLLNSAEFSDIIILFVKCILFGSFVMLIPIWSGLNASNELTSIPIAVLNGMVRVFIAIIIIEVLTLIVRSI